jgi:hypothetical protein
MKNVLFAIAFMLMGTFAFANTSDVETVKNENAVVESVKFSQSQEGTVSAGSMEVTLSCGITGTLSWTGNPSTSDIIDAIMYFDNLLC